MDKKRVSNIIKFCLRMIAFLIKSGRKILLTGLKLSMWDPKPEILDSKNVTS